MDEVFFLDVAGKYLEHNEPSNSEHLWRYTPWKKIHPLGSHSKIPQDVIFPKAKLSLLDGTKPEQIKLEKFKLDGEISENDPEISASFIRALCGGNYYKISIPKNMTLEQPLFLELNVSGYVSAFHLVLENHSNSKLELITSIQGDAEWFGLLREGNLKSNSNFSDLLINQMSVESSLLRAENFTLDRDVEMHSATLSLGGSKCKSDIRALIQGKGVNYNQKIAIHGVEKRSDDTHLRIIHESGNSNSRVIAHTICDDSSKNTTTGKLIINEGAQNTDAGQKFLNLLLSESARANSIPELEVLANDVLAAHGASSAPIDDNQLFYLRSRGLNLDESKALIVEGFLMSIFDDFPSKKLIEWAQARLLVHLECRLVA